MKLKTQTSFDDNGITLGLGGNFLSGNDSPLLKFVKDQNFRVDKSSNSGVIANNSINNNLLNTYTSGQS